MIVVHAMAFTVGFLLLLIAGISITRGEYEHVAIGAFVGSLFALLAVRSIITHAIKEGRR